MNAASQSWWRPILEFEAKLPAVSFITSVDDPLRGIRGGQISEANPRVAALCILHHKSHRLSTPEEIERFHREQKEREEALAAAERIRNREGNVRSTTAYQSAMKELSNGN